MKKIFYIFFALLIIFSKSACSNNANKPDFEVSASLYPWCVQAEGIEVMLDNLIELAGVNSVYLISVMHPEKRPFNGPRGTGPWNYPHNPVRHEWEAEDSRVFFDPDMNSYGRIKPLKSSFSFLRQTDWLQVVVDAARERGLMVGAEISHTFLPREIIHAMPEIAQRDIDNNIAIWNPSDSLYWLPCINHPDVREYLLALYGDIVKNYDIDYVQTCKLVFARTSPSNGTCFCESCQKEAKELGFDLAAAIPILRDNPAAQPQLDQWNNFRRESTAKIYKLIVERMRQEKPNIDFRMNDCDYRRYGQYLEDLRGFVTSNHMSLHSEQRGVEATEHRASRIKEARSYLGSNVPIIPGIPVRLLMTPDLVKSVINTSVANDAKGIALKHYDGASFSLLRAVKDGLSIAGVKGFSPHFGLEVEKMTLSGFESDFFLMEHCVKTTGTGTALSTFTGESGVYDVVVSYVDGKSGQIYNEERGYATLTLSVGGEQKITWNLDQNVECWLRKKIPNVRINKGDEVKIVGIANAGDFARIDYIEFLKK